MRLIPAIDWIRTANRDSLLRDLVAGLTVSVMVVPQAMAYAMLAGLPPVVGLHACTLPVILHAFLTSSRHLSIGPVALVSIVVYSAGRTFAEPGTPEFIGIAATLAFMTGAAQIFLGFVRGGFLINFVSRAVSSGFISAAAIIICLSQVKNVLGIDMPRSPSALGTIGHVIQRLGDTNMPSLLMGAVSLGTLLACRRWYRRFPAPLVVVILGTAITAFWRLDNAGILIVREVPAGLPSVSIPEFSWEKAVALAPHMLVLLMITYMQCVAVAKLIAMREKYRVDANRELIALGLANMTAAFVAGYGVDGSLSRTAVNRQAGGLSPVSGIVTALVVIFTLIAFTPLFHYLPKTILAVIIIVAAGQLIDLRESRRLFRLRFSDGATWLITFVGTLLAGIMEGILIGVILSLIVVLWRSAHPHVVELGYVKRRDSYRDVARYDDAEVQPGTLILRVDRSLSFTNAEFVEDFINEAIVHRGGDLKRLVLDFSGVNDMDAVATQVFQEVFDNCRSAGIECRIAGMKGPVRDMTERAGWNARYGETITAPTIALALEPGDRAMDAET